MESLARLSNDELLDLVKALSVAGRRVTAELVAHLGEVDARRLYADRGYPSLFSYCVEVLGFSEDEACRRIEAARLARRFPPILEAIASGAVSLTVLGALKPHLNSENHAELLAGVERKSVKRAREWIAARFPAADVAESIRRLGGMATGAIAPLSAERFALTLTVSKATREKLELARDLLRHVAPRAPLELVVDRALDALLRELRASKLGETARPRDEQRPAKRSRIASATRREVVSRDGLRCSFVAPDGHRCEGLGFLEFDHVVPKGRGGGSGAGNVRILCRAHNRLEAERVYGKEAVNHPRQRG